MFFVYNGNVKIIDCFNKIYKYKNNDKPISDGVTFIAFVFTNDNIGIDELATKTQNIIDEFHLLDFSKFKNNYCICHKCENGILINYQLDEDYPNENEYKKFLKEVKSLSQIQNEFADSIKIFKKLYLVYYAPTTTRSFEFSGNVWKQIEIKDGYA